MATPRQDDKNTNIQDATRKATEQTSRAARAMGETGERVARAGADIMQRNTEAVQQAWESASGIATRMTERSADHVARVLGISGEEAEKAQQQSSRNLGAIVQSTSVLSESLQNVSREWFEFARKRMEQNLGLFETLLRARTPQDIAAVQSEAVRDNLQDLLHSTRRIAEISMRASDEAARQIASVAEAERRAA